MSPRARTALALLLAAAGVGLVVWKVQDVGLAGIQDGFERVGWGFLVILALSFLRFLLRSVAWTTLIGERVPLGGAVAATIAGDALGNLTPLSLLVSEPAKSFYMRAAVPPDKSFAALTVENFLYSVSVAIFIVGGTGVLLARFVLDEQMRMAALAALALMIAILIGAVWIVWRRPAVVSGALERAPLAALRGLARKFRGFEDSTYAIAHAQDGRVTRVVIYELLFHMVSVAESFYVLWLLTGAWALPAAFVLDTVNRVVNVVFRLVPMRAGVDEVGTSTLAVVVGFDPATGLTIALLRKARMLVWAAVGLALMVRNGWTRYPSPSGDDPSGR